MADSRNESERGGILTLTAIAISAIVAVAAVVLGIAVLSNAKQSNANALDNAATTALKTYINNGMYNAGGVNLAATAATQVYNDYVQNSGILNRLLWQGDTVTFQLAAAVPDDSSVIPATITPGIYYFVEDAGAGGACGSGAGFSPCFVAKPFGTRATSFRISVKSDNDFIFPFPLFFPGGDGSTKVHRQYATSAQTPLEIYSLVDATGWLTQFTHYPFHTQLYSYLSTYAFRINPQHATNATCPFMPAMNNLWPYWDQQKYFMLQGNRIGGEAFTEHFQGDYTCMNIPSGLGNESQLIDTVGTTTQSPQPLRQVLSAVHDTLAFVANHGVPGDKAGFIFYDSESLPVRDGLSNLTTADIVTPGTYKNYYDATDPASPMAGLNYLLFPRRIKSMLNGYNSAQLDLPAAINTARTAFETSGNRYSEKRLAIYTGGVTSCINGAGTCNATATDSPLSSIQASLTASVSALQTASAAGIRPYLFMFGEMTHTLLRKKATHCATNDEIADAGLTLVDSTLDYTLSRWHYFLTQLAQGVYPKPINGKVYMIRPCCSTDGHNCADVQVTLNAQCAAGGADGALITSVPGVIMDPGNRAGVDDHGRLLCDPRGYWWSDQILDGLEDLLQNILVLPR